MFTLNFYWFLLNSNVKGSHADKKLGNWRSLWNLTQMKIDKTIVCVILHSVVA